MHRCAVFCAVHRLTGKQGIAVLLKLALHGEVKQQRLGGSVNQVLGQICKNVWCLLAEMLETLGVLSERIA
jgi:hypothetical protein